MTSNPVGKVLSIWRHPVKSLLGEQLSTGFVFDHGLEGDRRFALFERGSKKALSAKRVTGLFRYSARLTGSGSSAQAEVEFPDSTVLPLAIPSTIERLAGELQLTLDLMDAQMADKSQIEPFFDASPIHLITTSTLRKLQRLNQQGSFDARRFRANIIIETADDGFLEDSWLGKTMGIGANLELFITSNCGRCVMTTHTQAELPRDPDILKTAAEHNQANVGVYATVKKSGALQVSDVVWVN